MSSVYTSTVYILRSIYIVYTALPIIARPPRCVFAAALYMTADRRRLGRAVSNYGKYVIPLSPKTGVTSLADDIITQVPDNPRTTTLTLRNQTKYSPNTGWYMVSSLYLDLISASLLTSSSKSFTSYTVIDTVIDISPSMFTCHPSQLYLHNIYLMRTQ